MIDGSWQSGSVWGGVKEGMIRVDAFGSKVPAAVRDEVQARIDSLTPRERDVFVPLVQGYTNRQVAEQLQVSVKTVDLYRGRVMKRLQAGSLAELVGMAIACGAVEALGLRAR